MKISIQDYQENALENLAQVGNYNEWLVSKFEKYLGENILEVGSGLGNVTIKVKDKGFSITPTDINRSFLKPLKRINKNAFYFNIINPKPHIRGKFDTIVAINVLEHVRDDIRAIKNIYNLLPDNGMFIVLVPAHSILFGSYDRLAGHHQRYSKSSFYRKLTSAGFLVESIKYYNKLSALGWFINARLFKRKGFPKLQLSILKLLVPFLDFFDKIIPFDFGISIICIASKSSANLRSGA